jgi:hypothetical protein
MEKNRERTFEEMMELIKKYPIEKQNINFHPHEEWEKSV